LLADGHEPPSSLERSRASARRCRARATESASSASLVKHAEQSSKPSRCSASSPSARRQQSHCPGRASGLLDGLFEAELLEAGVLDARGLEAESLERVSLETAPLVAGAS